MWGSKLIQSIVLEPGHEQGCQVNTAFTSVRESGDSVKGDVFDFNRDNAVHINLAIVITTVRF